MNIVALVKLVPDLVEEITVDASGTALDTAYLRLIINESDDHSLEQSILLKERGEANVSVIAPDMEGADDVLYAAAAKGVDKLIKLCGDFADGVNNHALARAAAPIIKELNPDLILTGVQANNDLDGPVGPLLAEYLGMPYVGYVAGVTVTGGKASVSKEYPGGLTAKMEVALPAVIGIQAAEQPPRYVAVSKVRQAMKSASIDEQSVADLDSSGNVSVSRMFQPEAAGRAMMIEGEAEAVAAKLVGVLKDAGLL
jgi:electron transfer flavoprotein beta subunit